MNTLKRFIGIKCGIEKAKSRDSHGALRLHVALEALRNSKLIGNWSMEVLKGRSMEVLKGRSMEV